MDCNVVKDLIPLYIDDCCSEESARIVQEHLEICPECKRIYESMSEPAKPISIASTSEGLSKINNWKASIMQSMLLFISFGIITIGVALEASTPSGLTNGYWALSLVIPSTGFLLSLANWYFIRLYKNRKVFSLCSMFATLGITACAYIWSGFHYDFNISELFENISPTVFIKMLIGIAVFYGVGIILTVLFCVLSKLLSNKYAAMLGKE